MQVLTKIDLFSYVDVGPVSVGRIQKEYSATEDGLLS